MTAAPIVNVVFFRAKDINIKYTNLLISSFIHYLSVARKQDVLPWSRLLIAAGRDAEWTT